MSPGSALSRLAPFAAVLLAASTLGGCGAQQKLRPAEGQSLPPKPAMAQTTPTPPELLTPPPIAQPERVNELLTRSKERGDDPFDLPPPG